MPKRQPFTHLCQLAAKLSQPRVVDLHTHTTASDGDCTPSQLVGRAHNAGLTAIAVTDHDTTNGIIEAQVLANSLTSRPVEVIAGVEVSVRHSGRGYHLLGLFVDIPATPLQTMLAAIRNRRRVRFEAYLHNLASRNVHITPHRLQGLEGDIALGRRHLARLLVESGLANTLHIAFQKFIHPMNIDIDHSVSAEEAITAIHDAGGIASLAHPPAELDFDTLKSLPGLDAVETNFPAVSYSFSQTLTAWAGALGLGMTAGSDYHGNHHVLGSRALTRLELDELRRNAGRDGSST